ncbi:Bardet-Biedl syndrome 2 protein [Homalodisca vitripennis]|nr:Bardet-Biedl syndrome 2 protein [Homalodisca vitripennis]
MVTEAPRTKLLNLKHLFDIEVLKSGWLLQEFESLKSPVIIHNPYKKGNQVSLLNVNQGINAICAGRLNEEDDKDVLLIGTSSNILAYHVENNSDIFFKEVADGVNAITVGHLGSLETPLAIVGGNCSIQGFDWHGNDPFWTVTGDNVRSLALVDFDHDGQNELVVGSDDYELRIFKEDAIIAEMTETEAITALIGFQNHKFGYALANGTVGVYDKLQRAWRVKSKNGAENLACYDLDGDGVEELITGWSSGKVDARNSRTGEVVFRDVLNQPVAGILTGDYTQSGRTQILACSQGGEVRGYDQSSLSKEGSVQSDAVRDLFSKKQTLLLELKNYTSEGEPSGIPVSSKLLIYFKVNMADHIS